MSPAARRAGVVGVTAVTLALAFGAAPRAARAGGLVLPEQGMRRTAMAAVVGRPDEPAAVFHNPAGLTLLGGLRLYVSFGSAFLDTSMRIRPWPRSDQFIGAPVDAAGYYPTEKPTRVFGFLPMVVATSELFTPRLVGALSFYVAGATGAAFAADGVMRYHLVDSYIIAPVFGLSLGWRALPWLSVGASINVAYLKFYQRRFVFPPDDQAAQLLGSQTELELNGSDVAPAWNAGLLLEPIPRLSLGVALTGRTDVSLEGPVAMRFGPDALIQTTLKGTQRTGLIIPWTLVAGANFDVTRYLEVGAELRYYFYRQVDTQRTEFTGLELITEAVTPKNYRDSWQVAGGLRLHRLVPRLEIMLGAHYDRTPAPASTVSVDQPTFSHAGFHSGVRYTLRDRYRLGLTLLWYRYFVPTTNDSLTDPPSNFAGSTSNSNTIVTVSMEVMLGSPWPRRRRPSAPVPVPAPVPVSAPATAPGPATGPAPQP